eukprot:1888324-Heterocapsa_arctica.AAC.1
MEDSEDEMCLDSEVDESPNSLGMNIPVTVDDSDDELNLAVEQDVQYIYSNVEDEPMVSNHGEEGQWRPARREFRDNEGISVEVLWRTLAANLYDAEMGCDVDGQLRALKGLQTVCGPREREEALRRIGRPGGWPGPRPGEEGPLDLSQDQIEDELAKWEVYYPEVEVPVEPLDENFWLELLNGEPDTEQGAIGAQQEGALEEGDDPPNRRDDPNAGVRIGEASNPGPGPISGKGFVHGMLRLWVGLGLMGNWWGLFRRIGDQDREAPGYVIMIGGSKMGWKGVG